VLSTIETFTNEIITEILHSYTIILDMTTIPLLVQDIHILITLFK